MHKATLCDWEKSFVTFTISRPVYIPGVSFDGAVIDTGESITARCEMRYAC